jgi:hypothetical protein
MSINQLTRQQQIFLERAGLTELLEGRGKLTSASGLVYEGDFADDKKHGRGKLNDVDGAAYEGEFVDNYFHGLGKLTYGYGDIY